MIVTVSELKIPARGVSSSIDSELTPHLASALGVGAGDILSYRILRRSLDARKKPAVLLLYKVAVTLRDSARSRNAAPAEPTVELPRYADFVSSVREPLIVGAGPAGLFAALALAMAGAKPVVLDRGRDVVRRRADIDGFFRTRQVNPESNLLYGEGGAGTWSDGKLFTRIRDPRMRFVLESFVAAGAPEEILYFSHPHIGSDRLPGVIASIREKIISLGGMFRWDACVESVEIRSGRCAGVRLANGEFLEAPGTLIAPGHSARNLIRTLVKQGVAHCVKGFQTGVRIEHPQRLMNRVQFGTSVPGPALGAAEYSIVSPPSPDGRIPGCVSFCMCPGGEIIPAVCEPERLCTNGMSEYARAGEFANSALVASFPPGSFPSPDAAFDFLESLEHTLYLRGGADFTAPAQNAEDFLAGRKSAHLHGTSYRLGVAPDRLDELLPDILTSALRRALPRFDRMIPGFLREGMLIGGETRVSSPVRFERDPATLQSSLPGLYLGGEGAGMAGGITSAAVDGIRLAERMMNFPDF